MSIPKQEYTSLRVKGPLYVRPVTPAEVKGKHSVVYILMGPTGSGKSTFIETLSRGRDLCISKDSLESVTQNASYYEVANLTNTGGYQCTLMDTPGFLDTKLSETRITKMILKNLDDLRESEDGLKKLSAPPIFVTILYFQPITDIRMGGSKRDAVKLLKAFAQLFNGQGITVVTTMWNHLLTAQRIEEANRRCDSLKKEIFAPSNKFWIEVTKFEYTMHSALSSLDASYWGLNLNQSISGDMTSRYQSIIRHNVLHRIVNAQQRLDMLAQDKHNATTERGDPCLLEVVLKDESAVLNALQSFLDDLYEIDPNSCSSSLPSLSLRIALKCRFRRFALTGKQLFQKAT